MVDIIMGSCCYESKDEAKRQIELGLELGYNKFRAMLFKPRTDKYSFQGYGLSKLNDLIELQNEYKDIIFVTEILDQNDYIEMAKSGLNFIPQIGARNAQNYSLLNFFGRQSGLTILFKNGLAMTSNEFIKSAEYLSPENNKIIYCCRGIRSSEDSLRFTPNLGSLFNIHDKLEYSSNPYNLCFDPSHTAGNRDYVIRLAKVGVVCGADTLEVEVHSTPDEALSDSAQTINFEQFRNLSKQINELDKLNY